MQRRAIFIALVFSILLSIFTIKLLTLQWLPIGSHKLATGQLSSKPNWRYLSVRQRAHELLLDEGRALFVDRNGQLIHALQYKAALIIPSRYWSVFSDSDYNELAKQLNIDSAFLKKQITELSEPAWLQNEEGNTIALTKQQEQYLSNFYNVYALTVTKRQAQQNAFHSIGYVAENPELVSRIYDHKLNRIKGWDEKTKVGVMGLERGLDHVLHGVEPKKVVWYSDTSNQPIAGLGVKLLGDSHNYYPLNVHTTLDLNLQTELELLLEKHHSKRIAVVILDINQNDIVAMLSKPRLFPGKSLKLEPLQYKNQAVSSYPPGSIYKIVTLAAALEYGVVNDKESFYCNGEYGKYGLSCWRKEGHGMQTLEEAFANSCNVAFAQIAERLTAEQIHRTATALGIIEPIGWHSQKVQPPFRQHIAQLPEEERGRSFIDPATKDGGIVAQTSIGQRDALISPLQAANMIASIVRNGFVYEARLASHMTYANQLSFAQFKPHRYEESKYQLHPDTASKLKKYMESVVKAGTGRALLDAKWQVAGKSGTAELGSNAGYNHYWFVGYTPVKNPKYAIAVAILDEKSKGTNPSTHLFKEIVNVIAQ